MTREEIKKTIKQILLDHKFVKPYKDVLECHSYRDDYSMDSLDFVELIMDIEKEYGIPIPAHIAKRMDTVARTIDYLHIELNRKLN